MGRVPAYLRLASSRSHQTMTSSSSKGHRHAATPGAQTRCLCSSKGPQPPPSHPMLNPPTPLSPRAGGSHMNRGGQMRACSSLLRVRTAFSRSPALPGHRGPPRGVGAVTRCYHRGWTHSANSKQLPWVCFSVNHFFPRAFPLLLQHHSAKGPISPHRIGTA